ncbi:M3 family oligoendopeptidase [Ilumatobacter sp.]|uniref:M3 family oligoendopeptidase n=1 Tax=Ilumatobacter sp. TaxID=1967498 RepID=UPI002A25B07E|nr:M3 family oligoendopeptidase [Ilumatobacter sp.]MDG0975720.1 M3 family oligoendopeptidase [Ilumatobacter sp.]MDG1391394.1 M3 family oligoendopeptidase [Ilumatobacter sp.]
MTDVTNVAWDIDSILDGRSIDELFDAAESSATELADLRGRVGTLDAGQLADAMHSMATVMDLLARAGYHPMLSFSTDTSDPARGAAMAHSQQRATQINTMLIFFELEWAAADDEHVAGIIGDNRLDFCRHHLEQVRLERPHLLSEAEETVLADKAQVGGAAWVRLFDELTSAIEVDVPDEHGGPGVSLMEALSLLSHPDRSIRQQAAEGVTAGLAPGLRTRAYVFNTLLLDKSISDRQRGYNTWISSRNLANEASDESVNALIEAVVSNYSLPQRWYRLKAQVLGIDKLADYDRMASVADTEQEFGWDEGVSIVRDAYNSFSPELADVVGRFLDEPWIDAPVRPGKRGGAFAAPVTPSHHPYVFLNWTGTSRDVATLAHELGHGAHFQLAREQGIFHQSTPLTVAETASVFGETVTSSRLLATLDDPTERFALLASTLEDSIATVFRQVAMNRFEDSCHTARRNDGELSVEQFGELWAQSQHDMLGDSVEVTEGYRSWWSYVPHFMGTPGYVYAYAYGQLLALSVYARYVEEGDAFVPAYLDLLRAGGSRSPEELGKIVRCDLADPNFWANGIKIVEGQLNAAEEAARAAGRIN